MTSRFFFLAGIVLTLGPLAGLAQQADAPIVMPLPPPEQPMSCAGCDLRNRDISGRDLTDANLSDADLSNANLSGATLDGAILVGANLEGANLSGARFGNSASGPADLTNANLASADLRNADLSGARMLFADLAGTDFAGADLTLAVLGPEPKVGRHNGRLTSFRGARMGSIAIDAGAADLEGAILTAPSPQTEAAPPGGITCGASDMSAITTSVIVSATAGSDDPACGASPAQACKTLSYAQSRCTAAGCSVLAMFGEFNLTATLVLDSTTAPAGARLLGGCVAGAQPPGGLMSQISAPPGGIPALSIAAAAPVVLENFAVLGTDAAASTGAPAVSVQVSQTAAVTIANSLVVAGNGGSGAAGKDQPAGNPGGTAVAQSAGSNPSCPASIGGTGAGTMKDTGTYTECVGTCSTPGCVGASGNPGSGGAWAPGGTFGQIVGVFCPPWTPNDGKGGGTGASGACGAGGTASTDVVGTFNGLTWTAGAGQAGGPGGDGGGGGGGGAGGVQCGVCFFVRYDYDGSSGGGGGAGGCGGPQGPGGQQGGASFAIVAADTSVVTLNKTRVVASRSGDGGAGGVGGMGGTAGVGAAGAGTSGYGYHGGKGGTGGGGGAGGPAGGGAGGNAGPSAAVALVGGAKVGGTGQVYYTGTSGIFGGGGGGGTSPGSCPAGFDGEHGVTGSVAEILTYP